MTVPDKGRPQQQQYRIYQEQAARRAIEWLIARLPYASKDVVTDMCEAVELRNSHYVLRLLRDYTGKQHLVLHRKSTRIIKVTVGENPPDGASPTQAEQSMTIRALHALHQRATEGVLCEKNPARFLSTAVTGLALTEATALFNRFLAAGIITQYVAGGQKTFLVPSPADLPDFELEQPAAEAAGVVAGVTLQEALMALLEVTERQQQKISELQEAVASREEELTRLSEPQMPVQVTHDNCWPAPSGDEQAALRRLGVI